MAKRYLCKFGGNAVYLLPNNTNIRFESRGMGKQGSFYISRCEKEQELIENLPAYKNGEIVDDYDQPKTIAFAPKRETVKKEEASVKESIKEEETPKIKVYPEVKQMQIACDILREACEKKGERYKIPRSKAEGKEMAEKLGISFPNL